jgi:eukaryotic-like serine/threonine-protein kinase
MESDTIIQEALIDKFEILSVIGRGGMATVYKAIQNSLNRLVALKVIHQNLVHDEEFVGRFLREAEVCGQFNHPNILTVFDCGSTGSVHYMSMEYLDGVTIRDMIRSNGPLNEEELVNYIVPIAQALGFIHIKGIVHRDVKSSNIMVTNEGRPVLMDFGIVYSRSRESLSHYGTVLGTPEYMSPEQAEGKIKVDGRSDIYSLGVIIFECLTGRLPFKSDNHLATLHQILHEEPPSVRSVNPKVPDWLSNIVDACLVKDRSLRISDGMSLANSLLNRRVIKDLSNSYVSGSEEQVTRKVQKRIVSYFNLNKKKKIQKLPVSYQDEKRPLLVTIFISLFIILTILCIMAITP